MRKLLVVDDSATIRKAVEIALKYGDYQVAYCETSGAVLSVAKEFFPSAILVDIRMEGKNGYEICKDLKADEHIKKIPVIFFGGEEFFDEDKARSSEYDGFIVKPFLTDEILKSLDVIIKRHQKLFPEMNESSAEQAVLETSQAEKSIEPESKEESSSPLELSNEIVSDAVVNQIESETRDSAVEYKDLFETPVPQEPSFAQSNEFQNETSSEQPFVPPEESIESFEPQEEAIEESGVQDVHDEMSYEEDAQDLSPENIEAFDTDEEIAETQSLLEKEDESHSSELQEENSDYDDLPPEVQEDESLNNDDIIRQIDNLTKDDGGDDVEVSSINNAETSYSVPQENVSEGHLKEDLQKKLYDSLEREIQNFIATLDKEEILAHIKKTLQQSLEKICREMIPDIAEREVQKKIEEILKEK